LYYLNADHHKFAFNNPDKQAGDNSISLILNIHEVPQIFLLKRIFCAAGFFYEIGNKKILGLTGMAFFLSLALVGLCGRVPAAVERPARSSTEPSGPG
jgi:hypothetical protein